MSTSGYRAVRLPLGLHLVEGAAGLGRADCFASESAPTQLLDRRHRTSMSQRVLGSCDADVCSFHNAFACARRVATLRCQAARDAGGSVGKVCDTSRFGIFLDVSSTSTVNFETHLRSKGDTKKTETGKGTSAFKNLQPCGCSCYCFSTVDLCYLSMVVTEEATLAT